MRTIAVLLLAIAAALLMLAACGGGGDECEHAPDDRPDREAPQWELVCPRPT